MDDIKLARIYAEIGEEQHNLFTPAGWENAIQCYNVATMLEAENITYFARLVISYLSIEKYYTINLIKGKKYINKAKDILNTALERNTENKELLIALAHLYYTDKKFLLARDILTSIDEEYIKNNFYALLIKLKLDKIIDEAYILEIISNFSNAQKSYLYNVLGANCIKKGYYKRAVELLNISLNYKEDNAFSYNKLGLAYYHLSYYKNAIAVFKTAHKLLPDFSRVYTNIGKVYVNMENYTEAINYLKMAVKINPYLYTAYNDLGVVYYKQKMYLSSIESYKKAIKINSNYYTAYNNLGISLKEIENYKESEKAYQKAIELHPKYYQAYNNLGTLLNKLNRHEESIECYKTALHINPKYKNAYINLERVYDLIESSYFV
jgi:tetratricopeptide (TPR) repeat protein